MAGRRWEACDNSRGYNGTQSAFADTATEAPAHVTSSSVQFSPPPQVLRSKPSVTRRRQ
jgi:hypothetical protein